MVFEVDVRESDFAAFVRAVDHSQRTLLLVVELQVPLDFLDAPLAVHVFVGTGTAVRSELCADGREAAA